MAGSRQLTEDACKKECRISPTNSISEGAIPCPYCGSYETRPSGCEAEQELFSFYKDSWRCDDCDEEFNIVYKMEFSHVEC